MRTLGRRCLLLALLAALTQAGCTRRFFRNAADREVEQVITSKNVFEPWRVEGFHAYPDGRARFADPFNPDRHPMPPDDPATALISPMPQKPKHVGIGEPEGTGYLQALADWDAVNRAADAAAKPADETPAASGPASPPPTGTPPPPPGLTPAKPSPPVQPDQLPPPKDNRPDPTTTTPPASGKELPPTVPPGTATAIATGAIQPVQYSQPDGQAKSASNYDAGLKTNERPYRITVEQSSELGLFNSREFQDRREDLYLSALPVTAERFAFSAQFFATEMLMRDYIGSDRADGPVNQWRANSQLGFQKLFPTGALLLFRFANSAVINLGGNMPRVLTPSTVSLDFTQPLLRGGGRAVTLEPLTQVERNLLYAIRAYARFRKEYYVYVAAGGELDPGNNIALGTIVRRSGDAPSQGYLPTLLAQAQLANEQQNVAALEGYFKLFQAIQEGGDVSQLQVDLVESQLLGSRAIVLQRIQDARDAIDRFKLQLGMPPALPLELDTTPVQPLTRQLNRFQEVFDQFEGLRNTVAKLDTEDPARIRQRFQRLADETLLVRGTRFREQFPKRWQRWSSLSDDALREQLKAVNAERRDLLNRKTEFEAKGQRLPAGDTTRLAEIEFELDLGQFEERLRRYEAKPFDAPGLSEQRRVSVRSGLFRDTSGDFVLVVAEARSERIEQIRTSWPALPAVKLCGTDLIGGELDAAVARASQAALAERFDLMNARGRLVDSWRKIAVVANSLLGVANVQYHIDGVTPPTSSNPFAFSTDRTRSTLTLNGELPLVRKLERNAYRATLIAFQRERRYLQFQEDSVVLNVRQQIRQLRAAAENYIIQQRAVELAYFQVENSLNVLQQPPRPIPAGSGTGSSDNSASAAAYTTQLLAAQRALPTAQNQLYSVYLNYLIVRLQLYRDLELMPLDARGVFLDELNSPDATRPDGKRPGNGGGPAAGAAVHDADPDRLPLPRPAGP